MSDTHLRAILPQIRQLFARGTNSGVSDGVLLRRYLKGRDEDAFATLVARHGAMVFSVCRGILRDEGRSEDAFQTVWLVLVRRGASIRVDDSLGGWLHGVAYRVALRSSAETMRNQRRERTGADLDHAQAPDPLRSDPHLAALHEEIARLPEPIRQPLVLCWLEGKTQVEAALEIGCGEATVRRRLASARDRLRTRLKLKHEDLDPTLAAAALTLPPRLVELATRSAAGPTSALAAGILREMSVSQGLKVAVGLAIAGLAASVIAVAVAVQHQPGTPIPTPLSPPIPRPLEPPPVVVAEPEPLDEPRPAGRIDWGNFDVPGRVVDPEGKPVPNASVFLRQYGIRPPFKKATTNTQGRFTFTTYRRQGPKLSATKPNPLIRTKTLPGGITITITETNKYLGAPHTDESEIQALKPWIVATAPGFGFGTLAPGEDVTIRLVADEPITGRITDEAGKPLPGARVRVRDVLWPRLANDPLVKLADRRRGEPALPISSGKGLAPWMAAVSRSVNVNEYFVAREFLIGLLDWGLLGDKPSVYSPLIPSVSTDDEGTFSLRGIGRERVAELYVDGVPGKASQLIVVANRPLDRPILIANQRPEAGKALTVPTANVANFGNRVELSLAPGRTLEGVVADRAAGTPMPGWRVIGPTVSRLEYPGFDRFFATTDALGRFRIEGFPLMRGARFGIEPPQSPSQSQANDSLVEERPHLGCSLDLEVKAGTGPQRLDIRLGRGVWITGKVVDDATGQGLEGQSIEYHVFRDNPFLKQDLRAASAPRFNENLRTNPDGTFRLRAYPGRGIVTAGGGVDYLEGVGTGSIHGLTRENTWEIFHDPRGFNPYFRNTTIEVNVAEDARTFSCELRLKKGKSRIVAVVDGDGTPVDGIQASGLENQIENPITDVQGTTFSVTNLVPGERREVVARCVARKLMGMAVVSDDGEGPVTLKLAPWANLKGRLVDDRGQPRTQGLRIRLVDGKLPIHTLNGRNYDTQEFLIDPDGVFRIEGLVPGARYRLEVIEGGVRILGDVTEDLILQPGETRDLEDVRVLKSKDGA